MLDRISCKSVLSIIMLGALLSPRFSHSSDRPYIAVGNAKAKKVVLAIAPLRSDAGMAGEARVVSETISSDLTFMDLFRFLPPSSFIETSAAGIAPGTFKMTDWSSIGSEFVIKARVGREAGSLRLEGHLYDALGNRAVLSKRYAAGSNELKTMAHTFANDIVTALTGLPGIFLTKSS